MQRALLIFLLLSGKVFGDEVTIQVGSEGLESSRRDRQSIFVKSTLDGNYQVNQTVDLDYNLKVKVQSLQENTSLIHLQEAKKDNNKYYLTKTSINKKVNSFKLSALILDPKETKIIPNMTSNGVLGVNATFEKNGFALSLLQSRIVKGESQSTNTSTPSFNTQTFSVDRRIGLFELNTSLSHFSFKNIDGSLAYEGFFLGNRVKANQPETAKFKNGFDGYSANAQLTYDKYQFSGTYLVNNEGDAANNIGYSTGLSAQLGTIKVNLEHFEYGSDSFPAFMLASPYNMVNIVGNGISLEYEFDGLTLGGKYSQRKPISTNVIQEKESVVIFNMEKSFEI